MSFSPARDASAGKLPAAALRARRRRVWRKWQKAREGILPVLVIVLLFALWEISVPLFHIPVYILPAPHAIAAGLWAIRGQVLVHTGATLTTVLAGFALSIVTAIPLAAVLTLSATARAAIYPLLILSQSIPKVALAPIFVLILGTNVMPKIVITFLVAFFPLVISSAAGLAATPRELIELGRSLQSTRLKELLRIRMPFAIPFIFSGLKVAITLSVIGAVVGEFVAADKGLGYLMTSSLAFFNTPVGFGAIMVLSIMAMLLFHAVEAAERIFFPWSMRMRT
jgi:NitT/TauT family transport system permease protein